MSIGFADQFSPCGTVGSLLRAKRSKDDTKNFIMDAEDTTFLMIDTTVSMPECIEEDIDIFKKNLFGFSLRPELCVRSFTALFPFEDLHLSHDQNDSAFNLAESVDQDGNEKEKGKYLLAFVKCATRPAALLLRSIMDGMKNGSVRLRCRLSACFPTTSFKLKGLFPSNSHKLGLSIDVLQQVAKRYDFNNLLSVCSAKKDAYTICSKFGQIKSINFAFDGGVRVVYYDVESTVRALLKV